MTAYWVTGSTLDVLRKIPDGTIDLVLSSPPFFALRSYLDPDDPAKGDEIGSEATPGEFIDTLLDVTEECLRVLAPHGTLAFELGDTYWGAGGYGSADSPNPAYGATSFEDRWQGRTAKRFKRKDDGGPEAKSLCLIPELYRMSLAYGFNPLTGRECTRWRVRNVVRWVRPNPPVGALGDKFRPATSEMVIACQSRTRYFDLDAVRDGNYQPRVSMGKIDSRDTERAKVGLSSGKPGRDNNPAGAPPLDWWEIPTYGFPGSHYATWPPALCEKPIKAMSPAKVCTTCGEPSRRIVETLNAGAALDYDRSRHDEQERRGNASETNAWKRATGAVSAAVETLGWTDCGHDSFRPGRILDPFAGSGTTLAVATGHSRDAIGIDLDARNVDLAQQRVGMFLTECTIDELADLLGKADDMTVPTSGQTDGAT
jgi:site-specific DNA-methyltransferase (adenine-specific)